MGHCFSIFVRFFFFSVFVIFLFRYPPPHDQAQITPPGPPMLPIIHRNGDFGDFNIIFPLQPRSKSKKWLFNASTNRNTAFILLVDVHRLLVLNDPIAWQEHGEFVDIVSDMVDSTDSHRDEIWGRGLGLIVFLRGVKIGDEDTIDAARRLIITPLEKRLCKIERIIYRFVVSFVDPEHMDKVFRAVTVVRSSLWAIG
jgi:hypothetical protein